MFEEWCEGYDNVKHVYKNGDKSESFFSINYSLYAVQMYKQLPQNLTDMQKKEINKCLEEGILTADRFLNSKATFF